MVRIRLFRTGTNKRPSYRIVAMDQRRQRQGRVLEVLGTYHPLEEQVTMRIEALDKWLATGAQESDSVRGIVSRYRKVQAAAPAESATS